MKTYLDERGPYVLEMASNADQRRRHAMSAYWADHLTVSDKGMFTYAEYPTLEGQIMIVFLPSLAGEEPRPAPIYTDINQPVVVVEEQPVTSVLYYTGPGIYEPKVVLGKTNWRKNDIDPFVGVYVSCLDMAKGIAQIVICGNGIIRGK